jgi:hypothetical protein
MSWILEHLQFVLVFAGAFAYWLKQRSAAAKDSSPSTRESQEGEAEERTRKIQEEIRRKIAERRGTAPGPVVRSPPTERPLAPPLLAPRPVAESRGGLGRGLRERLEEKLAEARARAQAVADAAAERQRQEQARALAAARAATEERTAEIAKAREAAAVAARQSENAPRSSAARTIVADLRDPPSVRRAIILREILGPPVGLQ